MEGVLLRLGTSSTKKWYSHEPKMNLLCVHTIHTRQVHAMVPPLIMPYGTGTPNHCWRTPRQKKHPTTWNVPLLGDWGRCGFPLHDVMPFTTLTTTNGTLSVESQLCGTRCDNSLKFDRSGFSILVRVRIPRPAARRCEASIALVYRARIVVLRGGKPCNVNRKRTVSHRPKAS